jgi:signal transduction histidine kinase
LRREVGIVRQQSNFLAAVSHELKSPLASIRLYTETMQLRQPDAQTCQRYLGIMRVDIDRLETLVGNLLAVARLDQGGFEARPTRVDVAAEVGQIVADMQPDMQARGAALALEISERPVWAHIDPAVLDTVMRNLLDNAAKYNRHNAPVTVRLTAETHSLTIEVIDRGIGLAAEELARIFTKFYRVGDEMVRQTEGSGLGLYLVASLWQHSGGKVRASSPGQGQGATFALVLPRVARHHNDRFEPCKAAT